MRPFDLGPIVRNDYLLGRPTIAHKKKDYKGESIFY